LTVVLALVFAYQDGLKEKGLGGKLPLHYALMNSSEPLAACALLEAYPEAASVPDNDGVLPLIYAISLYSSATVSEEEGIEIEEQAMFDVLSSVLLAYPEGAQARHPSGLLPFTYLLQRGASARILQLLLSSYPAAIDEKIDGSIHPLEILIKRNAPSSLVYECISRCMPIDVKTGDPVADHGFWWTYLVSQSEDRYADVVEMLLSEYGPLLADCLDQQGRQAVDIATPRCKAAITSCVFAIPEREVDEIEALQLEVARLKTVVAHRDAELQSLQRKLSDSAAGIKLPSTPVDSPRIDLTHGTRTELTHGTPSTPLSTRPITHPLAVVTPQRDVMTSPQQLTPVRSHLTYLSPFSVNGSNSGNTSAIVVSSGLDAPLPPSLSSALKRSAEVEAAGGGPTESIDIDPVSMSVSTPPHRAALRRPRSADATGSIGDTNISTGSFSSPPAPASSTVAKDGCKVQ
jgi:hypothetical protein